MNGTLFSSEGALRFVIFGVVALGLWLQRFKVFKTLGPALTVIVTGILLSNLKVVPTSSAQWKILINIGLLMGVLAGALGNYVGISVAYAIRAIVGG